MHSRGLRYSALLHGAILVLLIFGLPDFFHRQPDTEPVAISVDILPIAPKSNVKPQEKQKPVDKRPIAEKDTELKQTSEAHKPNPTPAPETPPEKTPVKPDDTPPPPKESDKPAIKKEPPPKKPKPKQVKPASPEEDFNHFLDSVTPTTKSEESTHPTQTKRTEDNKHPAKSDTYDASQPLSMSEKDAIRQQVEQQWSPPIGAKDAANLKVTLRIAVAEDGTVTSVELPEDKSRYNSDSFFRAAADSAMRAVKRASPLKNLPPDKFKGNNGWGDMEMTFDPRELQ